MERLAVMVIGSNSTRLLAADAGADLARAVRGRADTRLFLGMTQDGALGEGALLRAREGITRLREQAAREGARLTGVYATSAVRDARNASALNDIVQAVCGLPLRVLSGSEEAAYSFYGAAGSERCGVVDIGGGSTEVALGEGARVESACSLQMGAARLFKLQPLERASHMERALALARDKALELPEKILRHEGFKHFFLVGGTGVCCALLMQGVPLRDGAAEGCIINRDALMETLARVVALKPEKRLLLPGFLPARADILPTGMALLLALMDALALREITVTERGNTDGLLRAFVHKKFA